MEALLQTGGIIDDLFMDISYNKYTCRELLYRSGDGGFFCGFFFYWNGYPCRSDLFTQYMAARRR